MQGWSRWTGSCAATSAMARRDRGRAAFKAVQDGKQVAVLVPTTLLVSQHYATFAERMSSFR